MRRSPIALGLVLGLLVGAAGAAAIAATGGDESAKPRVVITGPGAPVVGSEAALPGGGPMVGVEITVRGVLPELRGEARGYRLGSEPAAGAVERLAAALGVHAPLQRDSGGWVVRESNRLVRVQRADGLPWFLSTFGGPCKVVPGSAPSSAEALPPVAPSGPTDCPETAGGGSVGSGAAAPQSPTDLPTRDDALAMGMEALGRAGLGVSRPTIANQATTWRIEASPLLGDKPTSGFAWTATIGPNGAVEAASGFLAKPEAADTYPLVGTRKGLERLKASTPLPMLGMPQCAPSADHPCPEVRPLVRTVTGVRQGLLLGHVGADPYLVPAYLFELEGQPPPVAPVPAIEDRWLAQPSPTAVPGKGAPVPG
ncbi:MAG: hypothetical protein QOF07_2706 [Bradyrhizobium sp.]|nr:hypothetical protein [Bradyrhizobium sp.]